MIKNELTFEELGLSSQLVRDLIAGTPETSDLIDLPFSLKNIPNQIAKKSFDTESRSVLHAAFVKQYGDVELTEASKENLEKLKSENTYTICTGHQLNLLTGPLYSIYKIAQVVSLSNQLQQLYPNFNFVPVFWMATEDHDYDEINHLRMFGKKLSWERETNNSVVGRLNLEGIDPFLEEVEGMYQNEDLKAKIQELTTFYRNSPTLTEATRKLINFLFGKYGLLILDGDDKSLKARFTPTIQKELTEGFVEKFVNETNGELTKRNYHTQVYVRDCNLFYIHEDGQRQRIERKGDNFAFGEKEYGREELLKESVEHPDRFSPNALMRPMYQETVLPNLVYLGGGGEIAYWLQLKSAFEGAKIPFPMIRTRDSYILLNDKDEAVLKEFNLQLPDLKRDVQHIVKEMALEESEMDFGLDTEREQIEMVKQALLEKAATIDKGLSQSIEGEFVKISRSIDNIAGRLIKAEKKKHEGSLKKLQRLQSKVFPENGFQERYDNMIPTYLQKEGLVDLLVELSVANGLLVRVLNI